MKRIIRYLAIALIALFSFSSGAQEPVFFYDAADLLESNYNSITSIAVADVNGDYRDDLIINNKDSLIIQSQVNNGTLFKTLFRLNTEEIAVETTNIGDFDNDNRNNILISGFYKGFINIDLESGYDNFNIVQNEPGLYYAQGSNVNDINNDGWLDAIITNDNGHNLAFENNGLGLLEHTESLIDFKLWSKEDAAGNYNAIWFDVDSDDDLDLFISKCYATATEPTDLRRINQLYINDSLRFVESASTFGLADGAQSWCADSGDLDNDGDIDLCVINHGGPSVIFENIGNDTFARHELFSTDGLIVSDDVQVTLADYNNDGKLDIAIAGQTAQMLFNKGDFKFEPYYNLFGQGNMTSMAYGDLNHDGWLDILGVFGGVANKLLLSLGGAKHFLQLSFFGKESNANGIGSKVEIYTSEGKQVRWVKSGTSYGITNSLNCHFGLNASVQVDSLICSWPSGEIDKYYNVVGDKHYILNEGSCMRELIELEYNTTTLDCDFASATFTSTANEDLIWSDGSTASSLETSQAGYVQSYSIDGCLNTSNIFYVEAIDHLPPPELNAIGEYHLCKDEEVILTSYNGEKIHWYKDSIDLNVFTSQLTVNESGVYYGKAFNYCDTINTQEFELTYVESGSPVIRDTFTSTENVTLYALGDSITWFDTMGNMINNGNQFDPFAVDDDTLFYYTEKLFSDSIPYKPFPPINLWERLNDNIDFLDTLKFESFVDIELHSITIETDFPGVRRLLITQAMDTIFSKDYTCDTGINKLSMDVSLTPGEYMLTTDRNVNVESLGAESPQFKLSILPDSNPININGYMDVFYDSTEEGEGTTYASIFEWDFSAVFSDCYSERIPYYVHIDSTVATSNVNQSKFSVSPNPTNDGINWKSNFPVNRISILCSNGLELISQMANKSQEGFMDVSILTQGYYIIQMFGVNEAATSFLIKI